MSDDRYDDFIDRESQGYRSDAAVPSDAMWSRIEGDVARAISPRELRFARRIPWIVAGAGIAAALVIGVAIGRRSTRTLVPAGQVASAGTTDSAAAHSRDALMRAMTVNHLGQVETFLTEVRADLRTGRDDPQRSERSRLLLARTRLLLANGAASAPSVDRLLEDLELMLAEIAALPDSGLRRSIDARLIDDRLRAGTVLPRIRTLLPPPTATGGP